VQALHTKYPDLDLPVEIVHGDADITVGLYVHSTRMVADIKGANLVVLPGVGHMPQHISHPEVITAINRAATRAGLR
jgi:pimeloyl-ACP methyl ester carboxylesterase